MSWYEGPISIIKNEEKSKKKKIKEHISDGEYTK